MARLARHQGTSLMPKGYIIGHITVKDPEAYKEYVIKDTPILKGMGAKFLVRGGQSETPEGATQERHVVIEFPSFEEAKAAYYAPDYQAVAELRRGSAESTIILVEGHDET